MSNKFVRPISSKSFDGDGSVVQFNFDQAQTTIPFVPGQPITVSRCAPSNFNGSYEVTDCDLLRVKYSCTAQLPPDVTMTQLEFDSGSLELTVHFASATPDYEVGILATVASTTSDDKKFNGTWKVTASTDTSVTMFIDTVDSPTVPLKTTTGTLKPRITNGSVRSYVAPPVINVTGASGTGTTVTLTFDTQRIAPYTPGQAFTVTGVNPNQYNGSGLVCLSCTTTSISYAGSAIGTYNGSGKITPSAVAPNTYPVIALVSVSNLFNHYVDWQFADGTFDNDTNCPFVEGQNMYANVQVTYLGVTYNYVGTYAVEHINQKHDGFGILQPAPGWISTNNIHSDNGVIYQTASGYCSPAIAVPPSSAWRQFTGYNVSNTLHTQGADYQVNNGLAMTIANSGHIGIYGNVTGNSLVQNTNNVEAGSGDQNLTYTSNSTQVVSNSSLRYLTDELVTQNIFLPDATTLVNGAIYPIINNATDPVTVKNHGGTTLGTVANGVYTEFVLTSNADANGTWTQLQPGSGGTVTSVAVTVPSWLSVSGSPITTSGTIAITGSSTGTGSTVVLSGNPTLSSVTLGSTHNITLDASLASADYTFKFPSAAGTSGQFLQSSGTGTTWANAVTSVAVTVPSWLSVSGSPITTTGTIAITGTSTGTGTTVVLSGKPTLTGAIVSNTITGTFTDAPLVVNNTNVHPTTLSLATAPNITANDTVYSVIGQSGTLGNGFTMGFKYAGNNSSNNLYTFGFVGASDDITVKNDGTMYVSNVYGTTFVGNTLGINSTHRITLDASLASADYTFKFPATTGTSGQFLQSTGTGTQWVTGGAGTGTVTSVAVTVPSWLSVSGSPITTSGTIAITGSSTGTGTTVALSGKPTLTGVIISNTVSSFTDAPLVVTNTNVHPAAISLLTAPNVTVNDTMYTVMGQSGTAGNGVAMGFKYAGNNSTNNLYTFGFLGASDDLTVKNDGTMYGTNLYATSLNSAIMKLTSTNNITLDGSLASADYTFKFPSGAGTSGNLLQSTGTGTQWASTTGSGNIVLAAAPTINHLYVTGTIASYTDAPLNVNNTFNSPGSVAVFTATSLNTNDTVRTTMGQSVSTGNAMSNIFYYNGNNNAANNYSFGFYGASTPDIVVTNNGTIKFNSNISAMNVSDSIASFTTAPLVVTNTWVSPGSVAIFKAPNLNTNDIVVITMGRDTNPGNSVSQSFTYQGNNNANNSYGFGFYGGNNDISVKNNNTITIGQNSSSVVTLPGSLSAANFASGTFSGQVYGWTGSLANPTGGPWNFTGNYTITGNVVTLEFVVSGSWSSAAVNSIPYISGIPSFGKTIAAYGGVLDSYASHFSGGSGQNGPYVASIGTGGISGHDLSFTASTNTLLGFNITGGNFQFGGVVSYYLI